MNPENKRHFSQTGPEGVPSGTTAFAEEKPFFVDVSNRALLRMQGADVRDLLHRITTNDLTRISPLQPVQTILTNEKGRMIDVVTVVDLDGNGYLLAGQSDNAPRLAEWLNKFIIMEDARLEVAEFRHFLIRGVASDREGSLGKMGIMFREQWGDLDLLHAVVNREKSDDLKERFLYENLIQLAGEEYEDFRVVHGIPAFPSEISLDANPLEIGLRHLISWSKGCYIGQEVIARLDTYQKVQRKLVRLAGNFDPDSLPAPLTDGKEEVGVVTSVARKVVADERKGLGYIKHSISHETILWLESGQGRQEVRFFPV